MQKLTGALLENVLSREIAEIGADCAVRTVERLGPFARWWLRPEVLQLAADKFDSLGHAGLAAYWSPKNPPNLPRSHGSCWIILARRSEAASMPLLRASFLLPLEWKPVSGHSERLPPALCALADDVLSGLRSAAIHVSELNKDWGLHLPSGSDLGFDGWDISDLSFDFASGWAPLAAGLLVAAQGATARPDPSVWATGRWEPTQGLLEVGGLDEKHALACEWNVDQLFVPDANTNWVRQLRPAAAKRISFLDGGTVDPLRALQKYRLRLFAEPEPADPFNIRKFYFVEVLANRVKMSEFYIRCLLDTVLEEQCRPQLEKIAPRWNPSHYVTFVSRNPELAILGARTFGSTHVLLLYTEGDGQIRQSVDTVKRHLSDRKVACKNVSNSPEMVREIPKRISDWLRQTKCRSNKNLVLDVTSGQVLMTLGLQFGAPRGSRLANIRAGTDKQYGKPEPGTELLLLWDVPAGPASLKFARRRLP